jgi:hypothetical protein
MAEKIWKSPEFDLSASQALAQPEMCFTTIPHFQKAFVAPRRKPRPRSTA